MKWLTAIMVVIPSLAFADITETEDAVHMTAHFGATYAMTHVGEVVCKKITSQSKLLCTIESAILANALNIGRKAGQGFPSDSKRAIISGALGTAAAGIVISIDW